MGETTYDFESGDLSLDFANTQDWHGSQHPSENLTSYTDLVVWGEQAGLVTAEQGRVLRAQADRQPGQSAREYESALQLREALYRIFSSLYAGERIPSRDLEILSSVAVAARAGQQLVHKDGELRWEWTQGMQGIDLILWPVARAAAELLTSDRAPRVRECEDDRGCGYLFIDQSKNRSRRWCSMEGCGNRAKARRHYARNQAG